jgi:hypothetical protein
MASSAQKNSSALNGNVALVASKRKAAGVAADVAVSKKAVATAAAATTTAAVASATASGNVLLTGDVNKTAAVRKSAESSYLKAKASEAVSDISNPYPEVWGIRDAYKIFNLEDGGLSSEAIDHARSTVLQHIDRQRSRQLGYQCNMHINAEKYVSHYLDTSVSVM